MVTRAVLTPGVKLVDSVLYSVVLTVLLQQGCCSASYAHPNLDSS